MNSIFARPVDRLKLVSARGKLARGGGRPEPGAAQLWAALCATSAPILIVDESDRVQLASAGAEQLFGEPSVDLGCGSLWDHVRSADSAPTDGLLVAVQAGLRQIGLTLFDGSSHRAHLAMLTDARGVATHVRVEITEQRPGAPVSRTLDAVGRMAGVLAHDVNNQLSAALNCVYLIRRRMPKDDTIAVHLHELQSALWRAATLVGGAKRLPHAPSPEPGSTSLNDTVNGLVPLLRHLAQSIEIETRLDSELPGLQAPIAELEQVILATVLFSIRRAAGRSTRLRIESSAVVSTRDTTGKPSVRLLCTLCSEDDALTTRPSPIPPHVDGGLRRALKRCGAHSGHDDLSVWIDFAIRLPQ